MLANLLAVIIGIGSLAFYLIAFILPEVHRRSDFFWSGVGMFYAVVLWYCSGQMGGAVLLGQTASVGLLLWLGYQTLRLRRVATPAAQQTPIWLGKSGNSRITASRPIAKDYEFVEDGVEDALDQDPDPDSPILIKPAENEFAVKMVVPAAMPPANGPAATSKDTIPADKRANHSPDKQRERPNPLAAVGIFAGWLKDVVTPKKKEPKPMIELPPRPPSIPKPDTASTTIASNQPDNSDQPDNDPQPEISANVNMPENGSQTLIKAAPTNLEPAGINKAPNTESIPPPTIPNQAVSNQDGDEDSNWPDDEFWD